jgi:methylated-DNA-[protein]-cysteine S-methyltransferase
MKKYSLDQTLRQMREHELIPLSTGRDSIRAKCLESFSEIMLDVLQTKIGWIGLAWTSRGILWLVLPRGSRAEVLQELQREFTDGVLTSAPAELTNELVEYAEGRRRAFDLPLDWSLVKPFQRAVLTMALKIPFGETRTYGWIARAIGKPRAARAVGRALATNPIPLILPCHRVVGSDGSLTGYGGGLPLKRRLLQMEALLARTQLHLSDSHA